MTAKRLQDAGLLLFELFLLYIYMVYYQRFQATASKFDMALYDDYRLILTLITLLMGMALEWRRGMAVLRGGIRLNPVVLLGAALMIGGLPLSYERVMIWFGIMNTHTLNGTVSFLLAMAVPRAILSMMAGVFLIRGIAGDPD